MSAPARLLRRFAVILAACAPASAHEGPPYSVIVDRPVGPFVLSVWADPDVGTGSFFVLFDPPAYRSPADPLVSVEVWPATGRLEPARFEAVCQRDRSYLAEPLFDREETWSVRVRVEGSLGTGETVFDVPVTPPGYGRWDLLVYAGPFLLLGALWVAVVIRRRRLLAEAS